VSLTGNWVVDSDDKHAMAELGNVLLEFDGNGNLNYVIRENGKDQIMLMTYEVDGCILVTDQPSSPRTERTAFSISTDGILTLRFGGEPFHFKRQ
jgi:hypothetical protein